jgi:hypothetical protein
MEPSLIENKKPFSHIYKGIIVVLLVAAVSFIVTKIPSNTHPAIAYLPTLVIVLGVALSGIIFSQQKPTRIFADIFSHGFKTAAVVICLWALYTFIAARWLAPLPNALTLQAWKKELLSSGNIMPQEVDKKLQEAINNRWVFLVAQSIFVSLISGCMGAGLGALVGSRKVVSGD